MKVINSKTIVGTLIVMCIIGFLKVPNLMGICNYPDKGLEHLKVEIRGSDKVLYRTNPEDDPRVYTYRCVIVDENGDRLQINDTFDNTWQDYQWSWSESLQKINRYYNRIDVYGLCDDEQGYLICFMDHDGLEGWCVGTISVEVVDEDN